MKIYRPLSPIKAMTFDLDDTLYDNRPVLINLEAQLQQWLHENYPQTQIWDRVRWTQIKFQLLAEQPQLKNDVSLWRFKQLEQGFLLLGFEASEAQQAAHRAMQKVLFWRNQVNVPQNTHQVLAALQQKIPLVGITNGNVDANKIGLGQYFITTFNAGPDGQAKPHEDMFIKSATACGVAAQNILHVGDHLRTDVEGAKRNGFQACWFNDQQRNLRQQTKCRILPDIEIEQLQTLLSLI